MKKLLFIILTVLLSGCQKETFHASGLTGEWNWLYTSGGFAGMTYTPESTGFTSTIEFTPDSIYRIFRDGELQLESNYHLSPPDLISYDETSILQSFRISKDTLTLIDQCDDCFMSIYIRIK
ncbi:MAG TPA: hypothetical protein VKA27_17915 [Sunxiuqinia sp.]|nr:hypothetical protein [Sunxiuqinia sp.]